MQPRSIDGENSMDTKWDVVVMGGGTAGLFAGIAAARGGAKTLLVERWGSLGGNIGTGMNIGGFFDGREHQVIHGIPEELLNRVISLGGGFGHMFFRNQDRWISSTASMDPETFKHVAFEMVQESDCRLWLYTSFIRGFREGSLVTAAEVLNKSGVVRLEAKSFIDTTGDADLAASVGAPFERGGGKRQQAVTCIFRVGGVNLEAVERYMEERINTGHKEPWRFMNAPLRGKPKYWTPWKVFPEIAQRFPKLFGVYYHGMPGDIFINCTHTAIDSLDPEDITAGTIRLRKQAVEVTNFLKKHVSGFENAYLTHVYDLGVRESRRLIGEYMLTIEDVVAEREFDDVVAMGAYPPDLHDAHGGDILIHGKGWRGASVEEELPSDQELPYNSAYQIPYRCLLPQGIDNLLVAGRCISATFEAQSGTRGMGPCSTMGEATGTAAALAARQGIPVKKLDISLLQKGLVKNGAYLGKRMAEAFAYAVTPPGRS
jgi:hypothetical protein